MEDIHALIQAYEDTIGDSEDEYCSTIANSSEHSDSDVSGSTSSSKRKLKKNKKNDVPAKKKRDQLKEKAKEKIKEKLSKLKSEKFSNKKQLLKTKTSEYLTAGGIEVTAGTSQQVTQARNIMTENSDLDEEMKSKEDNVRPGEVGDDPSDPRINKLLVLELEKIKTLYNNLQNKYTELNRKLENLQTNRQTQSTARTAKPSIKKATKTKIDYTKLDSYIDYPKINSSNRFQILSDNEDIGDSVSETESVIANNNTDNSNDINVATKENIKPPPPIVAYNLNLKEISVKLSSALASKNYKFRKVNKDVTHIFVKDASDYKTTMALLKSERINNFSYTSKENKPISIVLKFLHPSYDENDIKEEFQSLFPEIEIVKVSPLMRPNMRNKEPLWLVQVKPISDISKVIKTTLFLNQGVKFYKFKPSIMTQCKNCQRFGHVATNCSMPYRCVKCKSNHGPGNCLLPPKNSPLNEHIPRIEENADGTVRIEKGFLPECVNCGQSGHPANYRKCSKYLEIMARKQEKSNMKSKAYNNYTNTNVSYASILKRDQRAPPRATRDTNHNNQQRSGNVEFLNDECNMLFGLNLFECLSKIDNFLPHYRELSELNSKRLALLSFLTELTVNSPT